MVNVVAGQTLSQGRDCDRAKGCKITNAYVCMHAQVGIAAANFVCGFILVIGSYVMEGLPETRRVQGLLVHFFRCVPPFNLGAAATPHPRLCRAPISAPVT